MERRFYFPLLLIIPLAYALVGFHFNLLIGNYSLRNMDPEYIYFMSGLGIANGHLHLGHFDNPGTPLQLLIATVFRLFYLFSPGEHTFLEDVFLRSDHYLNMANHVVLLLVLGVLVAGGIEVLKITGNIGYALMLQTAPFFSEITYDIAGRLIPELLMPVPVVILSVMFLRHLYQNRLEVGYKSLLLFALVSGFGLAIKMTFIPFWLIPLFVIESWKKRAIFLGASLLAFFLIAVPVTLEIKVFYGWMRSLLLYSGTYGSGESNFVDPKLFVENLRYLWNSTPSLFWLIFGMVAAMLVHVVSSGKGKVNKTMVLLAAGILLAVVIQLALSSKHYAYRYIIPTLAFMPLMGILTMEFISRLRPGRYNQYVILAVVLLLFVPGTQKQLTSAQIRTKGIGEEMLRKRATWHQVQTLPADVVKIIVSQAYGAPLQEYVIAYSTAWAGPRMDDYREVLAGLYPHAYMYNTWDDQVKFFGEPFNAVKLASEEKPVLLYLEHDTPELFDRTMQKFFDLDQSSMVTSEHIYTNPDTREGLYWLHISELISE